MRGLIQRVTQASVTVDNAVVGEIDQGILLLLGVQKNDTLAQADKLLEKIIHYRIFLDDQKKMNLSLKDIKGGLLIVSQFTLAAETKKGLRPGFSQAAEPVIAEDIYNHFVERAQSYAKEYSLVTQTGIFAADMKVALLNDGPVTFLLET